jgi:hypothetical protein
MPRTQEDVENYLLALGRTFETAGGTLVVNRVSGSTAIAIRVQPPIVEIHAVIGAPPNDVSQKLALFQRLLELNASDLAHAAYALEQNQIVLISSLSLDNLDQNELEAVMADIDMALLRHLAELRELAGGPPPSVAPARRD